MEELTSAQLAEYFNNAPSYRGVFFVEMKRQTIQRFKYIWTYEQMALITNIKHPSVSFHANHSKNKFKDVVEANMRCWVLGKVYPKTIKVRDKYGEAHSEFKLTEKL